MGRLFLPLLAFFPIVSSGQDGAQLYTTYCAACHAAGGKGATVGTFPPLAGSPFAAGAPDRAAKIVIKGLERRTVDSPPAGQNVVHPSKTRALPENARFTGYDLDPAGSPAFSVAIGSTTLVDSYRAGPNSLIRKLTLTGNGPAIELLVSDRADEPQISISADGDSLEKSKNRTILKLSPDKSITLTYRWK